MSVKVAINGFGRIGRLAFRQMFGAEGYEVVAINDLTSPKMLAHLLKYDSAQRRYEKADTVVAGEDSITVDGKTIKIYAEKDAKDLPWGEIGVDVVLECTGFYTSKDKAQAHIDAGAKKVVISAPAGSDLKTIVYGVNENTLTKDDKIMFSKNIVAIKDHSSYLLPTIDEAFKESNIDKKSLNKIIVGIGPGSFTGTRIAITVAKVLAFSLNIDIYPISSLEEFIYSVDGYDYYVPIIEEKNDKLYFSIFDKDKNRVIDDAYSNLEDLYKVLENYKGKIVLISNKEYEKYDVESKRIDIINLIDNVLKRKPENVHTIKPNYIKRIEVESKL